MVIALILVINYQHTGTCARKGCVVDEFGWRPRECLAGPFVDLWTLGVGRVLVRSQAWLALDAGQKRRPPSTSKSLGVIGTHFVCPENRCLQKFDRPLSLAKKSGSVTAFGSPRVREYIPR